MRTPLTDDELSQALAELPAWSGDRRRIERTVLAPAGRTARLRERVARLSDELDHHPVVEDVPGGTRFVLWTHVRGAVTELDVALARRIDEEADREG